MADRDYHIDWSADLTPALALLGQSIRGKRDSRRADQYAEMQALAMDRSHERQSAEEAREIDREKRKRAIEDFNARDSLFRMARRSPEAASNNPYGYSFDAHNDLPANVEGPELSPTAEAARFQLAGGPPSKAGVTAPAQAQVPVEQPPQGSLMPAEEGPELDPTAELARHTPEGPQMQDSGYQGGGMDAFGEAERLRAAGNMDAIGSGLHGEPRNVVSINEPFMIDATPDAAPTGVLPSPESPAMMQPQAQQFEPPRTAMAASQKLGMEPGPEGQRRIFASYQGGDKFEIPEQLNTTGFGPKYDAYYNNLLELGETPKDAMRIVASEHKSDQVQAAIGGRVSQQLTARDTRQEDQQTFQESQNKLYKSEGVPLAYRDRWERERNAARIRAVQAGQSTPLKIDTANRQDMGALRTAFAEWKKTVNLNVDSKLHKRLSTAMQNLDSGNALQQREAAESLVSIFKGGGQVTKASQDLLLNHLAGIVGDAQTWMQHKLSGHYGAAELKVLQDATRNALKEEQEKLHGYHESAQDTFGPGSGWEQLGANVNAMTKGAFKQFGYDAESIYPDATEPVVLGSGVRPPTQAKPKMSPDQAVQMARERLKKNPNDEVARRVIQLHGGQ